MAKAIWNIRVERVKIDRQGYEKGGYYDGKYWGVGQPLYRWSYYNKSTEEDDSGEMRANSAAEVKAYVRKRFNHGKRTNNMGNGIKTGVWTPVKAIKRNADGSIDVLKEKTSRQPNISQGFMAGGVFHPIRSAADYDPSRAGEGGKKKKGNAKKKAPAKKKAATKKPAAWKSLGTKQRIALLAKKYPYQLHHDTRGYVKAYATKAALDAEYKRRNGRKNGYSKKVV